MGYRYFVTHLMGDVELSLDEQLTILHQFRQVELRLDQWIELAAVTLARAAGNVSVVSTPIQQTPRLHHVEIVSLRPRLGLVIFVTTDGAVRQVMARWPEPIEQPALSSLADSLGASLRGLKADEIEAQAAGASGLARSVLEPIAAAMLGVAMATPSVRHSGLEHVLAQPEFGDATEAQELLTMLISGSFLDVVLPRLEDGAGVRVFIGRENPADALRRFGVVVSTYGVDGEVTGLLGVVGPTRMAYDRSISSVKYMAKLMSSMVANLHTG
jgi:heat-inducible transcriptional repressor